MSWKRKKTLIVRLYQVLCEYSVAGRPLTPGSSTCGTKIAGSERGKDEAAMDTAMMRRLYRCSICATV